ncbi:Sec-independent protein secretion pathway component TatC [Geoglobus ahangari]|uniref:Sec-independent protein translocase protein TatC n=1 Tax=Geoglobus ahangari TaxID=113653 RepID=A0A0F7IHB6_9EURY|nr:twin-arginine translocase subunit TatC [Geoglobus ahangari]AKG92062.1 Sec-independent protein secretion pathway component TatC [Geoglobus ahangari]
MSEFTAKELAEVLVAIRVRLIRILAIVAVVWAISFLYISDFIIQKIKEDLLPEGANLIYQAPLEGMILKLKISLILGFIVALPYIVVLAYRTLRDRTEFFSNFEISRSQAIIYGIVSVILFAAGVAYGYTLMLPLFLQFLYESAKSQGVLAFYSLAEFINFVVMMLAVFGVIFQMPLFMYILVKNGITSLETFKYYRRHFYVAFFTVAAIVTPPDVFTQLMVGVPMVLFYEISLIVVRVLT